MIYVALALAVLVGVVVVAFLWGLREEYGDITTTPIPVAMATGMVVNVTAGEAYVNGKLQRREAQVLTVTEAVDRGLCVIRVRSVRWWVWR